MKKVLLLAVLAMFVMVPFTSFAKSAITDSDLQAITAQEGVTVDMSGLTVTVSMAEQAWGDGDGFGATYTKAGWVGATDVTIPTIGFTGELTIDVGTDAGGTTAIKVGLPSLVLNGDVYQTVALGDSEKTLTQVLGTSYMHNVNVSTSGSLVITAH
jgi:hypothetical protein